MALAVNASGCCHYGMDFETPIQRQISLVIKSKSLAISTLEI